MISRELDILAHRWYHTVGAPHLSLLLFLFAQADLLELASYKVSEEMFHLGFLAGVASERAIGRSVRLADYDDTVACLASANKGIRTIEMLQESGALPAFTDDELAQIARTKHALRRLIDDLLLHGNDRPGDSPPEEAAS
jgi:hypothetical protein